MKEEAVSVFWYLFSVFSFLISDFFLFWSSFFDCWSQVALVLLHAFPGYERGSRFCFQFSIFLYLFLILYFLFSVFWLQWCRSCCTLFPVMKEEAVNKVGRTGGGQPLPLYTGENALIQCKKCSISEAHSHCWQKSPAIFRAPLLLPVAKYLFTSFFVLYVLEF